MKKYWPMPKPAKRCLFGSENILDQGSRLIVACLCKVASVYLVLQLNCLSIRVANFLKSLK